MDIHFVRVPQDVEMSGESQRNEENVPQFFRSMLTAMMVIFLPLAKVWTSRCLEKSRTIILLVKNIKGYPT